MSAAHFSLAASAEKFWSRRFDATALLCWLSVVFLNFCFRRASSSAGLVLETTLPQLLDGFGGPALRGRAHGRGNRVHTGYASEQLGGFKWSSQHRLCLPSRLVRLCGRFPVERGPALRAAHGGRRCMRAQVGAFRGTTQQRVFRWCSARTLLAEVPACPHRWLACGPGPFPRISRATPWRPTSIPFSASS